MQNKMKKLLRILYLNKYISLFSLFFIFGCNNFKSDKKEIFDLINSKTPINKNIEKIFILTENDCSSCNKMYSNYLSKNLNNKNALFIINASGNLVDISSFENSKLDNVVIEDFKDTIFKSSRLIFLSNRNIDTIINVNYKNVEEIIKN
jgi:hypothetical protein